MPPATFSHEGGNCYLEISKKCRYFKELIRLESRELQFKEGSRQYWLPVQEAVLPYFEKELREGESVDLYAVWLGINFVKQHFFIVNHWVKSQQPKPVRPKVSRKTKR